METGSYLMNYTGCQQCKEKTAINNIETKSEHDDDGNETVTFKRKYQSSSQCTSTCAGMSCDITLCMHNVVFNVCLHVSM